MGNGQPTAEQGLSSSEAAARLRKLGAPPETSSRSTSSIVAGNVFTVVNSYIGIRQELKAKATLEELAVLVAPRAEVIRDGSPVDLIATEVVPGDVVQVTPGDQLI